MQISLHANLSTPWWEEGGTFSAVPNSLVLVLLAPARSGEQCVVSLEPVEKGGFWCGKEGGAVCAAAVSALSAVTRAGGPSTSLCTRQVLPTSIAQAHAFLSPGGRYLPILTASIHPGQSGMLFSV